MRLFSALFIAAALAGMSGCDGVTPPDAGQRDETRLFQTGSLLYRLHPSSWGVETTVDVMFTNATGRTAYIVNRCGGTPGVVLEKLVGGEWVYAWSPALNDCVEPSVSVDPGQTKAISVWVAGAAPGSNQYPQFKFAGDELDGVYRLVLTAVYGDYPTGPLSERLLPQSVRVSNQFALQVALF